MTASAWFLVGLALSEPAAVAGPPVDVVFESCTEFVGIEAVPIANVADLVPDDLTIAGDGTTALLVVRVVDCGGISVEGQRPRPGRLSQIGVTVVGDGTADIDNYTLWYTTTHARLHAALTSSGMNAPKSRFIGYCTAIGTEGDGPLWAGVIARRVPSHFVDALVQTPASSPVPFVARWIQDGRRGRVDMTTTFPTLEFGVADSELTTPAHSALADIIGGPATGFTVLDSYNAFDSADMQVSVD